MRFYHLTSEAFYGRLLRIVGLIGRYELCNQHSLKISAFVCTFVSVNHTASMDDGGAKTTDETSSHFVRITSGGKIKLWVEFCLNHLRVSLSEATFYIV